VGRRSADRASEVQKLCAVLIFARAVLIFARAKPQFKIEKSDDYAEMHEKASIASRLISRVEEKNLRLRLRPVRAALAGEDLNPPYRLIGRRGVDSTQSAKGALALCSAPDES
jgi:hypothetical protein